MMDAMVWFLGAACFGMGAFLLGMMVQDYRSRRGGRWPIRPAALHPAPLGAIEFDDHAPWSADAAANQRASTPRGLL